MTRGRKKGSYSKWSPERVSQIVEMAKTGMSYSEIGATMGEQGYVIRNLLNRYGVYVTRKDVGQPRWQPIETAPRNGSTIIVYEPGFYQTAAWTGGGWTNASNSWLGDVTHWMPLPKPPKE